MLATHAEAHAEWHRNTGLQYGCPEDACHPEDPEYALDPEAVKAHNEEVARQTAIRVELSDAPF
jgi:hypothetical protein